MFCPKCGKESPDHEKFCDGCGCIFESALQDGQSTDKTRTGDIQLNEASESSSVRVLADSVYTNLNYLKWLLIATVSLMMIQSLFPKYASSIGQISSVMGIVLLVFSFIYVSKIKSFFEIIGAADYASLCGRIKNSFIILIVVSVLVSLLVVGCSTYAVFLDMKEGFAITSDDISAGNYGKNLETAIHYLSMSSLIIYFCMAYPFVNFFYIRNIVAMFLGGTDVTSLPVKSLIVQALIFCAVSAAVVITGNVFFGLV